MFTHCTLPVCLNDTHHNDIYHSYKNATLTITLCHCCWLLSAEWCNNFIIVSVYSDAECRYNEFRLCWVSQLSQLCCVVILSVVMLSVVLLSVMTLNVASGQLCLLSLCWDSGRLQFLILINAITIDIPYCNMLNVCFIDCLTKRYQLYIHCCSINTTLYLRQLTKKNTFICRNFKVIPLTSFKSGKEKWPTWNIFWVKFSKMFLALEWKGQILKRLLRELYLT